METSEGFRDERITTRPLHGGGFPTEGLIKDYLIFLTRHKPHEQLVALLKQSVVAAAQVNLHQIK